MFRKVMFGIMAERCMWSRILKRYKKATCSVIEPRAFPVTKVVVYHIEIASHKSIGYEDMLYMLSQSTNLIEKYQVGSGHHMKIY